jgi:hypothetical protein
VAGRGRRGSPTESEQHIIRTTTEWAVDHQNLAAAPELPRESSPEHPFGTGLQLHQKS